MVKVGASGWRKKRPPAGVAAGAAAGAVVVAGAAAGATAAADSWAERWADSVLEVEGLAGSDRLILLTQRPQSEKGTG